MIVDIENIDKRKKNGLKHLPNKKFIFDQILKILNPIILVFLSDYLDLLLKSFK
jgi:hypothetical protein